MADNPNQGGGIIDDMMDDLGAPAGEPEEGPSLGERGQDVKDQVNRGKQTYNKLRGKGGADKSVDAAKAGKKVGDAGKAGAKAAQTGAKAAKTGATTAKAGAAAAAGAPTAGVGAAAVLAADVAGNWAIKHKRTLLIILVFLVFCSILIFAIGGSMIAYVSSGGMGKAFPQPAGSSNPSVKTLLDYAEKPTDVAGFNQMVFLKSQDKEYVQSGKIDSRLVKALNYLISKHKSIRISHIISDYKDMNLNEAGSDTSPQIIQNISAHKDGLAADIDEIDFVYKVFEESTSCSAATNGLKGDIVYYNDLNEELLRLKCMGNLWDAVKSNTTFNGKPAEAIPIKILYQDCKPNIIHAGNELDPCVTITDPIGKEVYDKVYQPEARRKVHLAIAELLQYPYDTDNVNYYRITQIITYSNERDVVPFQKDGTLDKLYGLPRQGNFGLFYMLEAWQNLHIAY